MSVPTRADGFPAVSPVMSDSRDGDAAAGGTRQPGAATEVPSWLAPVASRYPLREFTDSMDRAWTWRDTQSAGRVLVLLPGAAGSGDVAFSLMQALQHQVRAISVGYPGGASPEALSQGLLELLDRLAVADVAIWGSSYGAFWAQDFAHRHADRVSALWLGNGFVDGADVAHLALFDRSWLESSTAADVQRKWLDATRDRPPSELRDLQLWFIGESMSAETLRGRLLQVVSSSALPAATGVARTVVSDCMDDGIIAPAVRERVAQRYPQARRISLDAGGHYPHLTHVDALLPHLRQWLEL